MKAFVSGQLREKDRIRIVYAKLYEIGVEVTHDWTTTDDIIDYSENMQEVGLRAERDIRGVNDADIYILMTDNKDRGKGMYAELGAALALAEYRGSPEIFIVGPLNHESIFYYHPLARHFTDLDSCISLIKKILTKKFPALPRVATPKHIRKYKHVSKTVRGRRVRDDARSRDMFR